MVWPDALPHFNSESMHAHTSKKKKKPFIYTQSHTVTLFYTELKKIKNKVGSNSGHWH